MTENEDGVAVLTKRAQENGYSLALALLSGPREHLDEALNRAMESVATGLEVSPGFAMISVHTAIRTLADMVLQLRGPFTPEEAQAAHERIAMHLLDFTPNTSEEDTTDE